MYVAMIERYRCALEERLDAHAPALEVADVADRLAREQLVAADVQAANRGERYAGIQMMDDGAGKTAAEIGLAAADHLGRAEPPSACTYRTSVKPSARRNVSATSRGEADVAVKTVGSWSSLGWPLVGERHPRQICRARRPLRR